VAPGKTEGGNALSLPITGISGSKFVYFQVCWFFFNKSALKSLTTLEFFSILKRAVVLVLNVGAVSSLVFIPRYCLVEGANKYGQ
jgi:hypothetical protein